MKTTQTLLAAVILSTGLLSASGANAALESRLGGLAVYDTHLNLTWLANANVNGDMTWSQANTWVAGLTVNGISGWRLPTTLQPDASCSGQYAPTSESYGYNCTGSEMGHLYYNELGGTAYGNLYPNANLALFQNVMAGTYWSSTATPSNTLAWTFAFGGGLTDGIAMTDYRYAWAVHSGDVAAAPVPAAAWLLGSGLIGLAGIARKRKVV
ncbi:hypothetical protein SCT_0488 [Sulfuricella sp. T08]|uniref:Lcl C-terminal domain-containing protein n=1 Tax=Sulfuricella sp. T08 TaxID=1632857 RepID=UPI000617976D|nr:DUF1566 domain-containing protein [Sulfuricella sp. T08]GAO35107.1 hypothetical protein SCT_0488 [Sulfuricella sp. T08]